MSCGEGLVVNLGGGTGGVLMKRRCAVVTVSGSGSGSGDVTGDDGGGDVTLKL